MNRKIQKTVFVTRWSLPLLVLGCLLAFVSPVNAETTVTNSVNVSAGGGESHAAVTTIINGEVVEDWSATSTEPIVYSKSINSSSTVTKTEVSTTPSQTTDHDQLKALIAKLQALISLYVSLLNN